MTLVKNNSIQLDEWTIIDPDDVSITSHNLIKLDYWLENRPKLISIHDKLGLLINGNEDIEQFKNDLGCFSLIAINFSTFADGRGYSLAKDLREKHHFSQELRAVGDILPDQALYLTRVGFNALALANPIAAELALNKLEEFSGFYQPSSI